MRILLITPKPPYPPMDGGAYAMKEFMEMLLDEGHTVRLIYINTYKHRFDPTKFPSHPLLRIIPVYLNTEVKALPFLFNLLVGRSPNLQRFRSKKLRNEIQSLLDSEEIDLIISESPYAAMELDKVKTDCTKVLRSHNVEANIWENLSDKAPFPKKQLYRVLASRIRKREQKIWKAFDGILSISSEDSQYIQSFNPYLLDLLPTVSKFPDKGEHGHRISFLGSMDWEPNIEAVKEIKEQIWPLANRRNPELEFHLAGKREGEEDWSDPDIRFSDLGMVKSADEFLQSCKIMLVPLRSGSGLKIKTLEAMAHGIVVIGTPLAFDGIEGEDELHFVIANSPIEFHDRLYELLENEERHDRISREAIALVKEKHSRTKAAMRFNELMQRLELMDS